MRTLTLVIVLVLTYCANVLGQSNCLDSIDVKKVNYLLDDRDWLIEQARLDSLQLVEYQDALTAAIALEKQARNESANKDTLITITNERSENLEQALNKEQRRVKRRERLLWVAGAVGIIKLGIALGIGLSSR